MATIIVGVDDSTRSEDAVALAGDLARAAGAELLAVCAFPFDERPEAHFNLTMRAPMRDAAEATLERLCEPLSDLTGVRRIAVADPSPARALLNAAADGDAALVVVGSSHTGQHARLHPGSTASRLLQGAPCPVLLAPLGHRLRPHAPGGRIAAAFDGSPGSRAALRAAALIAHAMSLPLRVTRVFARDWAAPPTLPLPPGIVRSTEDAELAARAELERAVAELDDAEAAFVIGDAARELARDSEVSNLMVIGSRGYGPAPAVLLGDVSGRLMRTSACPVVIIPNGVKAPLDALFAQACGELLTRVGV